MSAKNEHGLTPQREKFAVEVASGKQSLSDAYRAAFNAARMKPETINEAASRLMADSKVAARVKALQAEVANRATLNAADILMELKKLAHSDISNIMDETGRVKLPHELDPQTRAAVASFKIDEFGRIEYKFWPKNNAIDMAMKHLGLFEKDNKQKSDPLVDLLASLSGNVLGPVITGGTDDPGA